jgi:hypothetical protein
MVSKEATKEGLQIFQKLSAEERTNPVYYEMQAMAYTTMSSLEDVSCGKILTGKNVCCFS